MLGEEGRGSRVAGQPASCGVFRPSRRGNRIEDDPIIRSRLRYTAERMPTRAWPGAVGTISDGNGYWATAVQRFVPPPAPGVAGLEKSAARVVVGEASAGAAAVPLPIALRPGRL